MVAVITLSAPAVALYAAPLLPLVVALVTKSRAHPALKAGLLAALAFVTALVAPAIQNGTDIDLDAKTLGTFVVTVVVAVAAHYGLLKPAGVTGADGKVASAVPGGIG